MKKLFTLLAISAGMALSAQNLVPNPSFEDTAQCPNFVSQINYSTGWLASVNTPDFYHSCNNTSQTNPGMVGVPWSARGYQPARTGNAMAGIVIYYTAQPDYREIFYRQLSSPLSPGVNYNVGMYVVLNEDNAQWAVDGGLGIYLSSSPINPSTPFAYTPQIMHPLTNVLNDSLNWTMISGVYTATGGEQYITIGSFIPDNQLTVFNRGGTYSFTSYAIDDVWVIPESLLTAENHFAEKLSAEVYPNPSDGRIVCHVSSRNPIKEISLYNTLGTLVFSQTPAGSGKIELDLSSFDNGIYFLKIESDEASILKKITIQH